MKPACEACASRFLPHIASETTPAEVIQRIAKKIEPFGWHTDLYFLPETFEVMEPLIKSPADARDHRSHGAARREDSRGEQ
jgi:hypothetical protein